MNRTYTIVLHKKMEDSSKHKIPSEKYISPPSDQPNTPLKYFLMVVCLFALPRSTMQMETSIYKPSLKYWHINHGNINYKGISNDQKDNEFNRVVQYWDFSCPLLQLPSYNQQIKRQQPEDKQKPVLSIHKIMVEKYLKNYRQEKTQQEPKQQKFFCHNLNSILIFLGLGIISLILLSRKKKIKIIKQQLKQIKNKDSYNYSYEFKYLTVQNQKIMEVQSLENLLSLPSLISNEDQQKKYPFQLIYRLAQLATYLKMKDDLFGHQKQKLNAYLGKSHCTCQELAQSFHELSSMLCQYLSFYNPCVKEKCRKISISSNLTSLDENQEQGNIFQFTQDNQKSTNKQPQNVNSSKQFPPSIINAFRYLHQTFFEESLEQILKNKSSLQFSQYLLEIDSRLHLLRKYVHKIFQIMNEQKQTDTHHKMQNTEDQSIRRVRFDEKHERQRSGWYDIWKNYISIKELSQQQKMKFSKQRQLIRKVIAVVCAAVHISIFGHMFNPDKDFTNKSQLMKIQRRKDIKEKLQKMTVKAKVSQNMSLLKALFHYIFQRRNFVQAELKYYALMRRPQLHLAKQFLTFSQKGVFGWLLGLETPPALPTNIYIYAPTANAETNIKTEHIFKSEAQVVKDIRNHLDNFTKRADNCEAETIGDIQFVEEELEEHRKQNKDRIHLQCAQTLYLWNPMTSQYTDDHQSIISKKSIGKKIQQRISGTVFETKSQKQVFLHEKIVIYIHGGGFMSNNTYNTQVYTRKWAKSLGIPFFSLDYTKLPRGSYPTPVDEVVRQYKFIVENIHKVVNISQNMKIVLAGDSAGGNIGCGLLLRLIKQNYYKIPNGFLLLYPPTQCTGRFTPSGLHGFKDNIAPVQLLHMCQQSYVSNYAYHIEVSPVLLKQEYIVEKKMVVDDNGNQQQKQIIHKNHLYGKWASKWPKTRMMVGQQDTLLDDSLDLLEIFVENKVDAKLTLYKDLPHAFLTQPCVEPAFNDCIELFKELLM